MNAFIAIILGLVQGLCEFLPISSSGHLLLLQKIFGISDGGLFFTVMLHLGTLAAVLVVYRKRIIEMLLHPVKQAKYWIWMIVATLVTAVMALVFKDVIDAANEGSLLGFCFLFTAALLVLCDFIRQKVECKLTVPSMKWYHAVFIGFVQGVAILPGISRSGSTITGATLCSMKKEDAAEFSFRFQFLQFSAVGAEIPRCGQRRRSKHKLAFGRARRCRCRRFGLFCGAFHDKTHHKAFTLGFCDLHGDSRSFHRA